MIFQRNKILRFVFFGEEGVFFFSFFFCDPFCGGARVWSKSYTHIFYLSVQYGKSLELEMSVVTPIKR